MKSYTENYKRVHRRDPARDGLVDDEARRILGQVRTSLEFSDPTRVLEDLHERMQEVQEAVMAASDAIGARYFMAAPVQEWTGEIV